MTTEYQAPEFLKASKAFQAGTRLTENQFIALARQSGLTNRREAVELFREYRRAMFPRQRLTGEALQVQQEKSAAGQRKSQKRSDREERRLESFDSDLPEMHALLMSNGFTLAKASGSGSRYYEKDGEHIRVSDHLPNEATQQWMDKVGADDVGSLNHLRRLLSPENE